MQIVNGNVNSFKAAIQDTPMTIYIWADDNWNFYSSGILSCVVEDDTFYNHAVLLVGYTADAWII